MEKWLEAFACRHVRTPRYHPRSNGLAERFVRTLKDHVRAAGVGHDMQSTIDKFLLHYRNSPHSTTGVAPAMRMKGRLLRSTVTALSSVGDKVWARQYNDKDRPWRSGTVIGTEGRRIVDVRLPTGAVQRCYNEQIKRRVEADDDQIIEEEQQPPVNGEQ